MCPEIMLAPSLSPKDRFLDRYDMNSIKTSKGSKPKGQPLGTKREKNFQPCILIPKIVAPKTNVKLKKNVRIK